MRIVTSSMKYVYDIQTLVTAFFPVENIEFLSRERFEFEKKEKEDKEGLVGQDEKEQKERTLVLPDTAKERWLARYEDEGLVVTMEERKPLTEREEKNLLKRMTYSLLSEVTNEKPPWGTLTGVRPTKLPMGYLMDGHGETETKEWMKETFLCREDKVQLSVDIAKKEIGLIRDLDWENGYSLYVGIPFCPNTCDYCSFPSHPIMKYGDYMDPYLSALEKELEFVASYLKRKAPTTVYIGGGTPTALSALQLKQILNKITSCLPMGGVKEFTVEAGRPDTITKEKLEVMKEIGVGRISINPQTMKEDTLRLIGRKHTVGEIKNAFYLARGLGFDNINIDLIVGLPGEDGTDFANTLNMVKELNPDSLTIHSLVVKRASNLRLHKEEMKITGLDEERDFVDEMHKIGYLYAQKEGYSPYYMYRQKHKSSLTKAAYRENIGYARNGKEGLYNVLIMEEKQTILALGAGAVSKFVFPKRGRMERVENVKNVMHYIDRIEEMIQRKKELLIKTINV